MGDPYRFPHIQVETWSHGILVIRAVFTAPASAEAVENLRFSFSPPDITKQYDPYEDTTPLWPAEEPGVFEYRTILEAKFCGRAVSVSGDFPGWQGFTNVGHANHRLVPCYPRALKAAAVLLAESRESNGLPFEIIPTTPQPIGGPTDDWFPGIDPLAEDDEAPIHLFSDNYQRVSRLMELPIKECDAAHPKTPKLSNLALQQLSDAIRWAKELLVLAESNKDKVSLRIENEKTTYLEWLAHAWFAHLEEAEHLVTQSKSLQDCAEGRPLPSPAEPPWLPDGT